jgi:glyoxylase-like metal-dependent hydrolase (beta-lactamase superfamily II)
VTKEEELIYQLKSKGIQPYEIKNIIISHFHADHIGGLSDFPEAKFFVSKDALSQFNATPNWLGFSKGILKGLAPEDLNERVQVIEDVALKTNENEFLNSHDLFGDKSIIVRHLPGHAKGQIGIEVQTERKVYFLISDACWLSDSYKKLHYPNPIVRLFFHSWSAFKESLKRVHNYHLKNPQVVIVPTHCSNTTGPLVSEKISFDVL